MKNKEIIQILKDTYPRDIRKQLVKTILIEEKRCDAVEIKEYYLIINQILSYVLKELNWNFTDSSKSWDENPLMIMEDVFPNIDTTKWYKEQKLVISNDINVIVS
ncbi:MAG: hypothetical protein KAJ49_04630 [Arcobacteraceae bacterium]|nr:hypothetical protein [Arcobacteraceae bacterium]